MAVVDPLFVGATRPAMVMGITYEAFVMVMMIAAVAFIALGPLWALLYLPLHVMAYLICAKDPRQFEHFKLWSETKGRCVNRAHWRAASYSPLAFEKRKGWKASYQGLLNKEIPVSKRLPYSSHVAPSVIYTDAGDYMVIFRLAGIAHESADDESVDEWHESLNTLLRNMQSPHLSIWTHIVRRPGGEYPGGTFPPGGFADKLNTKYQKLVGKTDLMVNELYVTVVWRPHTTRAFKLFAKAETTSKEAQVAAMRGELAKVEEVVQQFEAGLSKYLPQRLATYEYKDVTYSEPAEFLGYLVNGAWERMPIGHKSLKDVIATARPFFGKEAFELRGATESVMGGCFAIKEYPSVSAPGYLNILLSLPFEFTLSQSFEFMSRQKGLSLLKRVQDKMENSNDMAASQVAELDDAMDDLASNRIAMGKHHLTLTVLAPSVPVLNRRMALAKANLSDCGIVAAREDVALEAAFWAQLPANFKYRPRLSPITSRNFVGFSSYHNYPSGLAAGNQWGPALALFKTTSGTPYYFNFHLPPSRVKRGDDAQKERNCEADQRVAGNTLGIGPTGSGKTVFQTFLMAMMEKYGATGVFFDKDRGAEVAIKAMGGMYLPLKNAEPTGFNPFALEPTPANLAFLETLVTKIVTAGGKDITEREREEIRNGIKGVMGLAPEHRRLGMLMQFLDVTDSESAAGRLKRWVNYRGQQGSLAWVFDNTHDELDLSKHHLFGFDMTDFLDNEEVRTPMMLYLFHRIRGLMDGRKFWMSIDEFWKALMDPQLAALAFDLVKTIRKLNGFIQFWTQNTGDVLKHPMGHAFIEQCVTHVYMPNPRGSHDDYVEGFKCSEREYEIIRKDMPEQELRGFLVKQGTQSAVCELNLKGFDDELAVLSGTASTVELMNKIIDDVGPDPADWLPVFQRRRKEA